MPTYTTTIQVSVEADSKKEAVDQLEEFVSELSLNQNDVEIYEGNLDVTMVVDDDDDDTETEPTPVVQTAVAVANNEADPLANLPDSVTPAIKQYLNNGVA